MAHTISIDVVDMTIPAGNNRTIPVINQPNPCSGYAANANEVRQLIQLSNYKITAAGTNKPITGNNYYEYFPEEQPGGGGGGGGGVTPAQVEAMIANSIDAAVSSTSKNAIQNKVIKKYVDDNVGDKVDKVSGKGLSTNDYTTAEKTKLGDLADIQTIGDGLSLDNGELSATGGSGGTSDYNDLENQPSINNITLVGNKSLSDLGIAAESDIPTSGADIGLGNVDNTSDLNKPISTATQAALDDKANTVDVYNKTTIDGMIPTGLSDLTDDATHRVVTDTEKTTWNGKQSALDATQMNAVNSGITAADVSQIATNTSDISTINGIIGDINDTLEEVL